MRLYKCIAFTSLIIPILSGCSGPILRVESNPEGADVFAGRAESTPIKIGKTPITITRESAPDLFSEGCQIGLSKDGFASESLFVPKTTLSNGTARWTVTLKQQAVTSQPENKDQAQAINAVAQGIAEAQQKIFSKNYSEAQRILEMLAANYSNVALVHDLLGNVFYIQKNTSRALVAYRRSYELNPNSPETMRMIEKLSTIQGSRKAANGGQ